MNRRCYGPSTLNCGKLFGATIMCLSRPNGLKMAPSIFESGGTGSTIPRNFIGIANKGRQREGWIASQSTNAADLAHFEGHDITVAGAAWLVIGRDLAIAPIAGKIIGANQQQILVV